MKSNFRKSTDSALKISVFLLLILASSCSPTGGFMGVDHYEAGMEAFKSKDYDKAAEELEEVDASHERYERARVTLAMAKFKIHLRKFKEATNGDEAAEHLEKMSSYAKEAKSKVAFKELLDESLAALKKAEESAYVKALLAGAIAGLKEHADLAEIKKALKIMAARMKDFLLDKEVRNSFVNALNEVKTLAK